MAGHLSASSSADRQLCDTSTARSGSSGGRRQTSMDRRVAQLHHPVKMRLSRPFCHCMHLISLLLHLCLHAALIRPRLRRYLGGEGAGAGLPRLGLGPGADFSPSHM